VKIASTVRRGEVGVLEPSRPGLLPYSGHKAKALEPQGSFVPRHMVRAGLLEPQSPMMEAHVLWQNAWSQSLSVPRMK